MIKHFKIKILIIFTALLTPSLLYAQTVEYDKPPIKVYLEDGTLMGSHQDFDLALAAIETNGAQVYTIERPDFVVTILEDVVDPPVVNPPVGSRCTPNANPTNYTLITGDLCLSDGLYTNGLNVPSDTTITSEHIGGAVFTGGDSPWTAVLLMVGNNSTVDGLKVHHPSNSSSDACNISGTFNTMKNTSCSHGGARKHKIPLKVSGSNHIIIDSWFYGEGRYVVQCFGGNNILFKNNVARWDKTIANQPTEPNATYSNYSCIDMVWENNVSLDYGIPETEMTHCGDFCMSSTSSQPNFRVQYLSNIVVNHDPLTRNDRAFRADQKGIVPSDDILLKNWYMRSVNSGFTIKRQYTNVRIENCTAVDVPNNVEKCDGSAIVNFNFVNAVSIKNDMCSSDERQSDWCQTPDSLSEYLQGL